ncbi:hypothetical protein NQ317_004011 [Molorchus minor]|uniref:Glucuronosyltransferase n=1 Tax=Molorchus minor TaxID=1323400 RepID=A0ABQ9JVI0_9CUCU|nr:hypothetical protein NQ317_004011 [Molorchus minor]
MISPNLIQTMMETFKDLPYKVVWKYDKMDIPNLPENVRIFKWLPQQDVLKHPNVKIFIFQGGLQSMEEAIFSNVPLIGIPFVFDQDVNVIKMAEKGIGLCLYKETLTKESFKEAILEVINNPSYKERTMEISELYKDQPMSGLEKVIWWMEYVMRHKGAHHLRSPFLDLPFYKSYLLDVIGFVLVIMFIFLFITAKTIVFIKNIVFGQNYGKKFKQK